MANDYENRQRVRWKDFTAHLEFTMGRNGLSIKDMHTIWEAGMAAWDVFKFPEIEELLESVPRPAGIQNDGTVVSHYTEIENLQEKSE